MKISFFLFRVGSPGIRPFFMTSLGIVLLSLLYLSCETKRPQHITSTIYRVPNGFAYRIYIHKKLAVQQETVPGIPGAAVFCDSADAVKISALVTHKIENRLNPSVTLHELDSLKIKTKC